MRQLIKRSIAITLLTTVLLPLSAGFANYNTSVVSVNIDNTDHWQDDLDQLKQDEKNIAKLWRSRTKLSRQQKQLGKDLTVLQRDRKQIEKAWQKSLDQVRVLLPEVYVMIENLKHGQMLSLDRQNKFLYQTYVTFTLQQVVDQVDSLNQTYTRLQSNIDSMIDLKGRLSSVQKQITKKKQSIQTAENSYQKNRSQAKKKQPSTAPSMNIHAKPTINLNSHRFKAHYWPIHGRVLEKFHSYVAHNTKTLTQGITIAGIYGKSVHATDAGKVIFYDWLPYYGITLIVDHGRHWYTIYAHLLTSTVDVGQYVKAGESIALVGRSGTVSRAALYFAIKHSKSMVNPLRYLPKR